MAKRPPAFLRRCAPGGGIAEVRDAAPAGEVLDEGVAVGEFAKHLLRHAVVLALVDAAAVADGYSRSILASVLQVEKTLV